MRYVVCPFTIGFAVVRTFHEMRDIVRVFDKREDAERVAEQMNRFSAMMDALFTPRQQARR
jgi:hypothetical protein